MLKTCSVCGKIHDINIVCKRKYIEKDTKANIFRKTNRWTEKSRAIRKRDNNLCKVCISGKYNTTYRYNYNDLSVHHIEPIENDYSKRLDSSNLITLCRYHHEMAEQGKISKEELYEMIGEGI